MRCSVEDCLNPAEDNFNMCIEHMSDSFRQAEEDEEFSYPEY